MLDIRSDNEILVDQSNDGRTTYRNAAKTAREGLELSLRGHRSMTDLTHGYHTHLSATFEAMS